MMPPGTSCSSQRPTSSIIATTALQDIPGQCVARAISFLGEHDKLTEWLALRTTKTALWRQGVDEADVLAATTEVRFLGGEESRHSPHTRYATQLLAQIAWEVDLLEDLAPKAAESFAASKPQLVSEDMPSMPVRPSSKTFTQSKRPASAGRPAKNPSGPNPNLDRETIVLQRWEKKLAFAFHLKAQRNKEVEIKAREQNSKIESVRRMHAKLLKESEELQYNRWQGRTKDHDDKIARSRCAKREICELMMNAAAARQAVLETNRRRILQEQAERQAKRMEQETERQSNAEKKRQDVRTERCVGKPRLRVAREISRKQALRLERIRSMEREDLRQRLQSRSPTATPSPPSQARSRPSSARTQSGPSGLSGSGFVPMPPSRPTSARRPHKEISEAEPLGPSRAVPDPSCIPLPRYVRRRPNPKPQSEIQGPQGPQGPQPRRPSPERPRPGCRSAPAGIAVARGQAVHDENTIDPLGLFPIHGLRCVGRDSVLEINTLDVADCFRDLVCWAWEDGSTQAHGVGTTFLTALDCDKVDLDPPDGSESLERPELEVRDMREATTATEGTEGQEAFCTCEPDQADQTIQTDDQVDQVDLSDYGLSTAEGLHARADSIPQTHAFDRPERVHLTTSSESTDS